MASLFNTVYMQNGKLVQYDDMLVKMASTDIPQPEPPKPCIIGGRVYKTVVIGNQEWLAENLDYKFDGLVVGETEDNTVPNARYYNDDEASYGVNGKNYGLLYNWYAAKYLDDHKDELLPEGWHVPTGGDSSPYDRGEIDELMTVAGGETVTSGPSTAGTNLKSVDGGWVGPPTLDLYGFCAYPSGAYMTPYDDGERKFSGEYSYAYFWSTRSSSETKAYCRSFVPDTGAYGGSSPKKNLFSIRLVRNV